jgi:peroxiredoxin (alkyl hydroperoxide reductase subunit C)
MLIGEKLEDFEFEYFQNNEFKKGKLSDYKNKWLILFFYPADFTFVCPTELEDLAIHYSEFLENNCEILSFSNDTVFVHKAWHDSSSKIKQITYPMASDVNGYISKALGIYIEKEGLSLRGTFIIDPEGILKAYEVNDNSIGRNAQELLRKLQASKYVYENKNEVCPANWKPGLKTLKPGIDLVGKL